MNRKFEVGDMVEIESIYDTNKTESANIKKAYHYSNSESSYDYEFEDGSGEGTCTGSFIVGLTKELKRENG